MNEPRNDGFSLSPEQQQVEDRKTITRLKERIKKLPEGCDLIELLEQSDIPILCDRQISGYGMAVIFCGDEDDIRQGREPRVREVLINPERLDNDDDLMVGVLLHEMWHAKQALNGYVLIGQDNTAEEACFFQMLKEADAESFAMDACYKLAQMGDNAPWDKFHDAFVVKDFYRAVLDKEGEAAVENGRARRVAFDGSFFNTFIRAHYHDMALQRWVMVQKKDPETCAKTKMDMDFFRAISKLSTSDYLKDANFEGREIYFHLDPPTKVQMAQAKAEVLKLKRKQSCDASPQQKKTPAIK